MSATADTQPPAPAPTPGCDTCAELRQIAADARAATDRLAPARLESALNTIALHEGLGHDL
jgi:hypothetical protein